MPDEYAAVRKARKLGKSSDSYAAAREARRSGLGMTIEAAPKNQTKIPETQKDLAPKNLLKQPGQHFDRNAWTPDNLMDKGVLKGQPDPVKAT